MELYKSRSDKRPRGARRDGRPARSFRNSKNNGDSRSFRRSPGDESTTATCAGCGTECEIPFVPKHKRPVYCDGCFRQGKRRGPDDEQGRKFRHSRTREGDRDRGGSRTKSRDEKFLKKQRGFFSNGSDKFYQAVKEKLFEILGGKVCSSCGFRDERALGFSHRYDSGAFDVIRRGGHASSWGKYVSDPELAREELKVLCLNCNEISQPMSKPKKDRSKPGQKKSRYLPR